MTKYACYCGSAHWGLIDLEDAGPTCNVETLPDHVHVLNTTIAPGLGTYRFSRIEETEARRIVQLCGIVSHVGHEAAAQVATELLGTSVAFDRTPWEAKTGDTAIAVKLRGRALEGEILTRAEMDEIGFDLVLVEVTS